jgi:DNA-binding CsgD family transcriptional regulator
MIKSIGLSAVGRTVEALTWAERVHAAHLEVREHALIPHPASQISPLIIALVESGRIAEARTAGEHAFALLVTCRVTEPGIWLAFHLGRVEWLAGHPAAARRWHAEAAALARSQGYLGALRLALSGLAASAALLGDPAAAGTAVTEASGIPVTGYLTGEDRLGEAWLHAAHGLLAQARQVLTEAAGCARDTGHLTSEALLLTDVARLAGARQVADRLGELVGHCDGALASARAHLAAALAADDPDALLAAAAELGQLGADLLATEAANAAAVAWRRRGRVRRAATAAGQAAAWTARCEGARSPLLASADTASVLTAREHEIALLAAAGTPSKDIADNLHLSVRTVDNHLHHAYDKLGVTDRRKLAERLSRVTSR